jgi:hypothetical protein
MLFMNAQLFREKIKADLIDDQNDNARDSIMEYVAEFLEFKYGASSSRTLKVFFTRLKDHPTNLNLLS